MNPTLLAFFLALLFAFLGLIIISVGLRYFDTSEMDQRLKTFVVEQHDAGQPLSLSELQGRDLTGSLYQRTILSWLNNLLTFLGKFTPYQTVQETNRRLIVAGSPYNFRAHHYYGFRILVLIIGALAALWIYQLDPSINYLLGSLAVLLIFLIFPDTWLRAQMRQRQERVRKSLPDALDMLSVCVSAGLSFDQALLRVGQTYKTPVGIEFARVVSEIEIGISRKQALRNMQARVDISELSSFVAVILQAEALGMSIADVLHSQAEQMRIYRQYRAKEIAQQLPAKMMVPLALFIFPALLAVILGPMLPVLQDVLR